MCVNTAYCSFSFSFLTGPTVNYCVRAACTRPRTERRFHGQAWNMRGDPISFLHFTVPSIAPMKYKRYIQSHRAVGEG